ncbi:MAG: acyl-CoA dehydrogenase family protein [Candidatus Omnitrophica bacterium]|nr:acyl-CoA dehydrogenase family protein [Candidatus Omnitrophota bacterium]
METLRTLPGDDVRQIMWRFAHRYDLAMLVQSVRAVARGPVARLVASGARNSHEWTEQKAQLLPVFDESGITAVFMDPSEGGFIEGPKNLALALVAFELSWVDAGASTCSLAGNLALSPIHERGTPAQREYYMSRCVPAKPGENRQPWRGAFALTEPLPFVGVETGMLSGKVQIAEWEEGREPVLQVEKRGRFITNMGFANFVTAAVDSSDPRIKGSCMVILEQNDPGVFDRGTPTRKLVHQLSSTRDPVFNLRVPAHRIIGGYTIKDGVVIPNYSHGEIIEAVFRRTRVTVGLMTAAKLLSAVEPVILYARRRFRGGEGGPGSPRYELGLQQKEDVLHRLVDIWATGEASASLGFAAARLFDELDPLEKQKDQILAEKKLAGRAALKELTRKQQEAIELLTLSAKEEESARTTANAGKPIAGNESGEQSQGASPASRERQPGLSEQETQRLATLRNDALVQFTLRDAQANVLCPACKLWNTGHGANMMREAVSLMGGYGITEDCPGFLGQKWMDAQLEATYEGPEAVQRLQLSITMTNELFLAQFRLWTDALRRLASERPGTGACTLATAMHLWLWTLNHVQKTADADGAKLYHKTRQGVTFALADALCWLLAARQFILDTVELATQSAANPGLSEGLAGTVAFFTDLCHVQCARASGEVGRICAELVFGYNRHPAWDDANAGNCYSAYELESLEGIIPGIDSSARACSDVSEVDQTHPLKAGPCAKFNGLETFVSLRARLDACLTGSRLAKDRAAEALAKVMTREALDYPV